ncbi:hypothetical protein EV702DRAFT_1199745 [Suillus placidus]|uniref:Uncharacterized protein n=1 Tax=Suillus placidus TaxID=48579 RepID=A0A9P6ZQZ1_9AGAM|nr:hypothetical protein EV702DRAFT_1199745 [Suillus placidus]
MVVSLGLGLLLCECCRAQEYEADEAGDDVPAYLGNSILGTRMGDQIEEKVVGIEAEVEVMLKDENLGLSIVRQDIKKRRLEEKKKLKEKRRAEEEKRAEEVKRAEEEKRVEEKRVEEEARLAKEATKVDKRVRKSTAKGKGKHPAADVEEPSKKKVKASPPDPPRCSTRDKWDEFLRNDGAVPLHEEEDIQLDSEEWQKADMEDEAVDDDDSDGSAPEDPGNDEENEIWVDEELDDDFFAREGYGAL